MRASGGAADRLLPHSAHRSIRAGPWPPPADGAPPERSPTGHIVGLWRPICARAAARESAPAGSESTTGDREASSAAPTHTGLASARSCRMRQLRALARPVCVGAALLASRSPVVLSLPAGADSRAAARAQIGRQSPTMCPVGDLSGGAPSAGGGQGPARMDRCALCGRSLSAAPPDALTAPGVLRLHQTSERRNKGYMHSSLETSTSSCAWR